jgi:hypothetical protein
VSWVLQCEVPKVDRGRGDTPPVLALILERQEGFLSAWNKKGRTKLVLCLAAVWVCVCLCVCVCVCVREREREEKRREEKRRETSFC